MYQSKPNIFSNKMKESRRDLMVVPCFLSHIMIYSNVLVFPWALIKFMLYSFCLFSTLENNKILSSLQSDNYCLTGYSNESNYITAFWGVFTLGTLLQRKRLKMLKCHTFKCNIIWNSVFSAEEILSTFQRKIKRISDIDQIYCKVCNLLMSTYI